MTSTGSKFLVLVLILLIGSAQIGMREEEGWNRLDKDKQIRLTGPGQDYGKDERRERIERARQKRAERNEQMNSNLELNKREVQMLWMLTLVLAGGSSSGG